MDVTAFYFLVSIVVFIFAIYEAHKATPNTSIFAVGVFTFVLQYIILPYVFIFGSWAMSTVSKITQIDYMFALFLSSFAVALYHFFKTYQSYLTKAEK